MKPYTWCHLGNKNVFLFLSEAVSGDAIVTLRIDAVDRLFKSVVWLSESRGHYNKNDYEEVDDIDYRLSIINPFHMFIETLFSEGCML